MLRGALLTLVPLARAQPSPPPPKYELNVPQLETYPDYTGEFQNVSGTVRILSADRHSTLQYLIWDLTGLDTACTAGAATADGAANNACGIHVHVGTSCAVAADVGGHFYVGEEDPWATVVYVVADGSGASAGSAVVDTGMPLSDLDKRAFVVHRLGSGGRIACGVLDDVEGVDAVVADSFSSYPGYSGDLTSVSGVVGLVESGDGSQVLSWNLSGVDEACTANAGDNVKNGCGIHVHAGTTCDVAADVGGHYYDTTTISSDPWLPIVYEVSNGSAAAGMVEVTTGVSVADMVGKAFVVHQLDTGGRIACAILKTPGPGSDVTSIVSSSRLRAEAPWWVFGGAAGIAAALA